MLLEIGMYLVVLLGGVCVGYWFLPVFFRHNPSAAPSAIAAHLKASASSFESNAVPVVTANAQALIATVKSEAAKLGAMVP